MSGFPKIFLPLIVAMLFALPSGNVFAGDIDFKDFNLKGTPKKFEVSTRIEYKLTDYLRDALKNGVTLNTRVQIRLGEHSSWWFNKDIPILTVNYQLKYHALSRHYVLSKIDTNEHWNFSSLSASLRKLGESRRYELPDITEFLKDGDDGEFYIFAIADMAPATLRLPLRIQSLFNDQYRLTSEGVLWPLP
ncbi:DUF4390 domain-containing protein [uncultured Cocleimonas sp.]|uniref:DUF4390 domain-containing protein n=1 Tax=uncultured Cocleimonas sp. TaxID=1051587 RepID=UPI0026136352|nr:DUF4390 domain-containing protein [uncultured Cocleimonas sp.]